MELGGQCKFLHWGDATDRHVRMFVDVRPEPAGGGVQYQHDGLEQGLRKPVAARSAVEALCVGVLLRAAGLDA